MANVNNKQIQSRIVNVANRYLRLLDTAQSAVERAQANVAGKVRDGVNALIEASKVEGLTGEAIVQAIDSYYLRFCVERGALGASSLGPYRTSVRMALALGIEFKGGLYNDKAIVEQYQAKCGKAGTGRKAAKAAENKAGTATGAKVETIAADAEAAAPEVAGRKVTLTAPKSADLGLIAPIFADIVGNPARLALFLDWYKATFTK